MKIENALDSEVATHQIPVFANGAKKYVPGGRVTIFGHSAHEAFRTNSTNYVNVPGTFGSHHSPGKCTCRLEVAFAVQHDRKIGIRMCDPLNNQVLWEFELQGGHAPNDWWSHLTTDSFEPLLGEPWPRQHCLQVRSIEGDEIILGAATLWVVDVT